MEEIRPRTWIDVTGKWTFESTDGVVVRYSGSDTKRPIEYGLSLNDIRFSQGSIATVVRFPSKVDTAQILFGYGSVEARYYSAGLDGWERGYSISEFLPGFGWRGLKVAGTISNIEVEKDYPIEVRVRGSRVVLLVNNIQVLEHVLEEPLLGEQIGLFAVGGQEIEFKHYRYIPPEEGQGDVFVVMQFSEPYGSLYEEVIAPVVRDFGLNPVRADEIFGPGIILEDIRSRITESRIVIAEVTPPNPNVFYELGYAHALNKPTVLLVQRRATLPFDIQAYRAIFYEDSIKGKTSVEDDLRKHMRAILRR